MADESITVPARRGKAARVKSGQAIKVVNTHGSQVVDTFAFVADDLHEFMSMEHCRPYFMNLRPRVGDILVTNKRRPILTLEEDTSPGEHDTLMAACDRYRYGLLGYEGYSTSHPQVKEALDFIRAHGSLWNEDIGESG